MQSIEQKAEEMRQKIGGSIFAFPIDPIDPFTQYTVTILTNDGYFTFPESLEMGEAAEGIVQYIETLKEEGHNVDFKRDVRFNITEAQLNAPSVTMRRIKKEKGYTKLRMV